jgi:type VI secretion lipoprotein, VC_A0113 family
MRHFSSLLSSRTLLGLIVAFSLLLTACSTANSTVGGMLNLDTDLRLTLAAGRDSNPDERGNASPVFLRLYELASPNIFERADFIDLYEKDEDVLAKDLIARHELRRLTPGGSREEKFVLAAETRYIGIYAEFFDYEDAKYKVVFPITMNNVVRNTATVRISGNTVILVDKK